MAVLGGVLGQLPWLNVLRPTCRMVRKSRILRQCKQGTLIMLESLGKI